MLLKMCRCHGDGDAGFFTETIRRAVCQENLAGKPGHGWYPLVLTLHETKIIYERISLKKGPLIFVKNSTGQALLSGNSRTLAGTFSSCSDFDKH